MTELRTGIAAACLALATASMIHADPPAVPANVAATITASTSVLVTWDSVSGADSYDVRDNGAAIGTSSTNAFSHTGLTSGSAHIYTVRASGPGGTSAWSNAAIAVTATFTDTTLIPRLTPIRASHSSSCATQSTPCELRHRFHRPRSPIHRSRTFR